MIDAIAPCTAFTCLCAAAYLERRTTLPRVLQFALGVVAGIAIGRAM